MKLATDFGFTSELDQSQIHDVLRNDRRRHCLEYVRRHGGETSVGDLAEHIAELETGESPPPRNSRQSVYVSLHQTHLPKLDKLSIVEYDAESKTVSLSDRAPEVEVYMEVVPKYGLSWGEYYFILCVLALLTVVAAGLGAPLFARVETLHWAVFYLVLIDASALYQVWTQRSSLLHRLRG